MTSSLSEEKPCPGRILADVGGGFAMGAIGGSAFHFVKGLRASPNGARFTGGMQALRMNGPRIGGVFAVWSGLFSTFNCAAGYVRQKEDPWNSIAAGAATCGTLSVRKGLRAAGKSAVIGGALLALMEGMGMQLANSAKAAREQQAAHAQAEQDRPQVDHSKLAAAVANRLYAAQQLPPLDNPGIASGGEEAQ